MMSELRDVTCHVGSHGVSFHPTQVNAHRQGPPNSIRTGWYVLYIYLPRRDGRLSWVVGYIPRRFIFVGRQSSV